MKCKKILKSKMDFIDNIVKKIHTLCEFIIWFYTKHNLYKSIIEYKVNNAINKSY